MSHYKPYPAYKDSGAGWLGHVPLHWEIAPLWSVYRPLKRTGFADEPLLSVYRDHGVVLKASRDDNRNRASDDLDPYQLVEPGNLVTNKMKTWQGSIAVSELRGIVSPAYFVYEPIRNVFGRYIHHLMRCLPYITGYMSVSKGIRVGQWDLDPDHFRTFPVLFPPRGEQERIVKALDSETARIDALIAKKSEFIDLLAKKRQALITHAVTKGLNPKAKMKDSGVEWIGGVPAHWIVVQLGKLAKERCDGPFGSGLKSEHYVVSGVRVVRLQNIGWAQFKNDNAAYISHEHWRVVLGCGHSVLPGDLLVAGLGDENNPLGRACVAPDDIGEALVKADCYRFRLSHEKALPSFVALSLSATAKAECGFMATGATRDRLNLGLASSRTVAIPPETVEQQEIVDYVHSKVDRIDRLAERTQLSIDLLKNRRSALITAAVTGQIDLRRAA